MAKLQVVASEGGILTRLDFSQKKSTTCSHANMSVSEASRIVECDECGASLDPWAVLLEFAKADRLVYHEELELKSLRAEYETLLKNIGRAKSQLQRLRGSVRKLGEEPEVEH